MNLQGGAKSRGRQSLRDQRAISSHLEFGRHADPGSAQSGPHETHHRLWLSQPEWQSLLGGQVHKRHIQCQRERLKHRETRQQWYCHGRVSVRGLGGPEYLLGRLCAAAHRSEQTRWKTTHDSLHQRHFMIFMILKSSLIRWRNDLN